MSVIPPFLRQRQIDCYELEAKILIEQDLFDEMPHVCDREEIVIYV